VGQRFCGNCGVALAGSCPNCGAPTVAGANFCGSCGTALAAPPPTSTSTDQRRPVEERRLATVLFADMSGFTSLSEHTDPEDVRALVDRCTALLGEIVDRYGGQLDKVIGDAVLAVWGAPVAYEDDPERAVRAALEMQSCARDHAVEFGGLALRVGVNTGELMFAPVGPDSHRAQTVMGDVVNTASRLQTSAPRGGVLVGEETWRATRRTILYDAVPPFNVKGKSEPLDAWLAIEPFQATPSERPLSSVPMVGRDDELEVLLATWQRVTADRRSHFTVVLGAPGIGKSRLCRELRAAVEDDGARVLHGRSLSYGESMGYGAFGDMVRQAIGIAETTRVGDASAQLERRVRELPGVDVGRVTEALSVITGIGAASVENRPALFDATREFVEALGREQPTALGFEDLHWAEPTLLDLIEHLAARVRDVPILFLASARPELFDARPTFGGGLSSYSVLPLSPLADAAADELTRELLQHHAVAPSLLERINDVAGGNPLFIEELASSVMEGTTDPTARLPTSVVSIISARLDGLPSRQRRLLMDASVIGRVFWPSMLEALDPSPGLDAALTSLQDREFIRREHDSDIGADVAYAFRHGSIREVAYNMLPRAERRSRHAAVAELGEERFGGRSRSFATVLAHHWKEAGDPERAIGHLLSAAEQADQSWAKQEAVGLYGEALGLLPEGDSRLRTVRLRRAVAETAISHIRFGDVAVSQEVLEGLGGQAGKSAGET
jgi:class 3 adenylate cyclase